MNPLCVGSANQYAKSMARKTQWDLKKRSGDFSGHGKSLGDYVNFTKASSVLPKDETDHKMSAILSKAQAGKKLSPDDWEYLRVKNPALYEKLREVEKEQEDYEKALKRCKTQDEARRLHVSKLGEILSAAKNGDESALYRLNRLTRTMIDFTKSDEYKEMPTEAEEAIERESERQAKAEALREEAAEKEAEREAASETAENETESGVETEAETVSDAGAETASETPESVSEKKAKAAPKTNAKQKPDAAPKTDAKPKAKAAPESVSASPKRTVEKPSVAPVVSPGQRAYISQRDAKPRRRAIDAKA